MFIMFICFIVLLVRSRCFFFSISNIISMIYRKPFGKHTWFLVMSRFFPLYPTEIDFMHTELRNVIIAYMIWSAIDGWKQTHRILPIHQFTDEFLTCCLSTSSSIAWQTVNIPNQKRGIWYLKNVYLQGDNSFRLSTLTNAMKKKLRQIIDIKDEELIQFIFSHSPFTMFHWRLVLSTFEFIISKDFFIACIFHDFVSHLHWCNKSKWWVMCHWKVSKGVFTTDHSPFISCFSSDSTLYNNNMRHHFLYHQNLFVLNHRT